MKGTIHMKVRQRKEGPAIRTAVRLKSVDPLDKLFLVRSFLNGIKVTTDEARVILTMIDAGVAVSDKEAKEASHD